MLMRCDVAKAIQIVRFFRHKSVELCWIYGRRLYRAASPCSHRRSVRRVEHVRRSALVLAPANTLLTDVPINVFDWRRAVDGACSHQRRRGGEESHPWKLLRDSDTAVAL